MAERPPLTIPPKDILGNIAEVCTVTPALHSTMDGLGKLGIGPFQIFDFNSKTVKHQELSGSEGVDLFEIQVAFAKLPNGLVFEIMQPKKGRSLMQDFLDRG